MDLTEAYLHIPILPGHRRFLRFCVADHHLQFRALPFGLSTAPRVFTKMLINPIAQLRQWGIHVHPYLDDLLIRSSSERQARRNTQIVMDCLRSHGFININQERTGSQAGHLGVIIDTRSSFLFLTQEQRTKTRLLATSVICTTHSRLSHLAKLMGILVANVDAVQ